MVVQRDQREESITGHHPSSDRSALRTSGLGSCGGMVEVPLGHQPLAHVVEVRFGLGLHFSCARSIGQPQPHALVEVDFVFRIGCADGCGQVAEFVDHGGDLLASQAFESGGARKLPFGFGVFGRGGVGAVRHGQ